LVDGAKSDKNKVPNIGVVILQVSFWWIYL
jgi:hypothetical protein